MNEQVTIEKLVHGGQGLATLADGRKVFVWNALPGEVVTIRLIKNKRSYAEAIAEEIVTASPERIAPRDTNYLATSPWQIMDIVTENAAKSAIVSELFTSAHVAVPALEPAVSVGANWQYRNKMEYSFWGDDDGLHLALYRRGTHGKEIVTGSALALPAVDAGARAVLDALNALHIRATYLKTVIVRCDAGGEAVASLYVKSKQFPKMKLPEGLKGLRVYYSNPKSPASVATEQIQEQGSVLLADTLLGKTFHYDVDSFFQVNIPVFEHALADIAHAVHDTPVIDMYAGVGSIGLSVAAEAVTLVELDVASAAMAQTNADGSGLDVTVVQSSTEKSLDYLSGDRPVIFDPPRAGLHEAVINRLHEVLPPTVVYLSCNPATQARDIALLQDAYELQSFQVYNFFPHTPHIETLAVLQRKQA